jgi:phage regulator Rha-like protein
VAQKQALVPIERIENKILLIRGQKVIIDADLAELYGVTTKQLNQQVKRNKDRFPKDFMFQFDKAEKAEVVTICDHLSQLKFSPVLPFAFTEHGAIMAASVLNSKRAIEISVYVVRAFVKLREMLAAHKELALKLAELERKLAAHDQTIISLMEAIKQLMKSPEPKKKRPIGFRPTND